MAGYNVFLSTTGAAGSFAIQNKDTAGVVKLVTVTKFRITGLSATTTYYVQVTAVDDSQPE